MTVDEQLGIAYLPVEIPTGDYYGGHRPGNNLFSESLVAVDLQTGKRIWHYQFVHHPIWDYDVPCAPILVDITVDGRKIAAVAQPTKQGFIFVFDRKTGAPVWPIEERAVEKGTVPREWYSPTQPFPTKPPSVERQGFLPDYVIDFTPALKAEALALIEKYKIGPLYTPPIVRGEGGKDGLLFIPNGAELARRFVRSRNRDALYLFAYAGARLVDGQRSEAIGHELHQRWRRIGGRRRRSERAGPAVDQAAVRAHQRRRSQQGRDRLADCARRDAGQHQEPSSAERPRSFRARAGLAARAAAPAASARWSRRRW